MILLQLTAIGIAIIYLFMSYYYLKQKTFNKAEFYIWGIIWTTFMGVSITPSSFNFILETFNIHRMMDLIMIIAFIVIYMLGYKNYVINKQLEKKINGVVRKNALKDLDKIDKQNIL